MKDAPLKIQLAWRRYLAKKEKRHIIQTNKAKIIWVSSKEKINKAKIIQKYVREWLVKIE